jgi:hypothetical protein
MNDQTAAIIFLCSIVLGITHSISYLAGGSNIEGGTASYELMIMFVLGMFALLVLALSSLIFILLNILS